MKAANPTSAIGALDENGGNLAAWLMTFQTRYRESFDKVLQAAKAVFPDIESVYTIPTVQSQVFIASAERFLKTHVPAWHMSDGELKFIALLSLIFSPPELGAPLYLIEELENHIHPRLLETLQQLLDQQQQALGDRAAQIIITTHSPTVVDLTNPDDLIVVEKKNGATTCRRPAATDDIRKLLEEAGLGELYYSGALRGA
jgi:predicted ATPase